MKIIVVGSNPGHKNNGPTIKNLYRWLEFIDAPIVSFTNVNLRRTSKNRPLKPKEYESERLKSEVSTYDKIIALGNTASNALEKLNIRHHKLPHPSPRNRQLNDPLFIESKLMQCCFYLYGPRFRKKAS